MNANRGSLSYIANIIFPVAGRTTRTVVHEPYTTLIEYI